MIESWTGVISGLVAGGGAWAPLLAVLAGLLASLMPCSLSTVPLVVGYVGGTERTGKRALALSLVFAGGMAITFTALGVGAALLGRMLFTTAKWWYLVLGGLMVLMALQTWGLFHFLPATYLTGRAKKKGVLGALLAGMLGGLFASPCSTPVLIVILGLVAQGGSILWGVVLLLCYSLGHGALVVAAGTSVGLVKRLAQSEGYGRVSRVLELVLGAAMLALGLYMFYLGF